MKRLEMHSKMTDETQATRKVLLSFPLLSQTTFELRPVQRRTSSSLKVREWGWKREKSQKACIIILAFKCSIIRVPSCYSCLQIRVTSFLLVFSIDFSLSLSLRQPFSSRWEKQEMYAWLQERGPLCLCQPCLVLYAWFHFFSRHFSERVVSFSFKTWREKSTPSFSPRTLLPSCLIFLWSLPLHLSSWILLASVSYFVFEVFVLHFKLLLSREVLHGSIETLPLIIIIAFQGNICFWFTQFYKAFAGDDRSLKKYPAQEYICLKLRHKDCCQRKCAWKCIEGQQSRA